jgi:hypothetical protein
MEAKLLLTRTRVAVMCVNIALTQNGKALQIKASNIPTTHRNHECDS